MTFNFFRLTFFRTVLGLQPNGGESTQISLVPLAIHIHSLPPINDQHRPPPDGTSVTINELPWTHQCPSRSIAYLRLTLDAAHAVALNKCIRTCIHRHSNIQMDFTSLKLLCPPPIHPPPTGLGINDHFPVPVVLPFPECHIPLESRSI